MDNIHRRGLSKIPIKKVDYFLRDNAGICGIRCEICNNLVEDFSSTGTRCNIHVDSEIVPDGSLN